jgi:tRNA threonylcarbamoyladenosine biosynthesis protein TsaE
VLKKTTKSAQGTKKLAQDIAKGLKGGEVFALSGDLGAGKTTFVQGLAEFFGIAALVTSPTYTLIQEYEITDSRLAIKKLVHVDCYRLDSYQELLDIGIQDYYDDPESVMIIEWAEKAKPAIPSIAHWIYFKHGKKENERHIIIDSFE